jgi:hypothetical protein
MVPPTPPPPVPPPPTPPQRIIVDFPTDVIDKLTAHDPMWWVSPTITLLAAVIALGAAVLAWRGLRGQIRAENRRARRSERLDIVSSVIRSVHETFDAAAGIRPLGGPKPVTRRNLRAATPYIENTLSLLVVRNRLDLMGNFERSVGALDVYLSEVKEFAHDRRPEQTIVIRQNTVFDALKSEFDNPSD